MKRISGVVFFIILGMLSLVACGKASIPSTPGAASEQTKLHRNSTLTATKVLTLMAIATNTVAFPKPSQTTIPNIDSEESPTPLVLSIPIETIEAFKGHNLRRIVGGLDELVDGFQWMDGDHLLLNPIIPQGFADMQEQTPIAPYKVINLNSGKVWVVAHNERLNAFNNGPFVRWSMQLGAIMTSDGLYNPDGALSQPFEDKPIDVSPSGTKILIASENNNVTWVDLLSGKKVVFQWGTTPQFNPSWSLDEMQVYAPNLLYGNASTGKSVFIQSPQMDGKPFNFVYLHAHAVWVLGGKYLLPRQWHITQDGVPGFLGMLDPETENYRNLSTLSGTPNEFNMLPYNAIVKPDDENRDGCQYDLPNTKLNGRYVWVNCTDGGRMIDLATFKSTIYPEYTDAKLDWSADGSFAIITHEDDSGAKILSGAGTQLKPMPAKLDCYSWHGTKNVFVYSSNEGRTLSIFDLASMSVQKKVDLPVAFYCGGWNYAADKMVLVDDDNSIWQIDYPSLDHLEQLTQPIDDMGWVDWSPDGAHIAFPAGKDIYVVDTNPSH